ncbi:cytochrome P460 family protein [Limnoglobus roseus]|uniref:Cytochrome P460 domain-containing protein n=1 Tax=Limnoglobus roseus TaxID=2598579 RepID=A0A5C1AAI5_9BACT|nr:cytochrome P460 family protein [Limnoglobus roseus]QEL14124.1 hypothetical protein PX52LOC_00990 [Limnoglobus roseus]
MSRYCPLMVVVALVGCAQQPAELDRQAALQPADVGEEIDFANWQKVGQNPIPVPGKMILECRAPSVTREYDPSKPSDVSPHVMPAIVVRVNSIGFEAFRDRKSPLPVGTVIVKEKHISMSAQGPPKEYGAMVKREPGYDPTRGDWEYVYVVRGPEKKVTRGQIESCIYCHVRQMDHDYVFRTYLKP